MSKRIPKICLHKASGKAVVRINGRDIYLGQYGSDSSKSEYDRLIREWQSTSCSLRIGSSTNAVTAAMLVSDYRSHAATYFKDSTEPITIKIAIDYLSDYFDLPANNLSPLKLKAG